MFTEIQSDKPIEISKFDGGHLLAEAKERFRRYKCSDCKRRVEQECLSMDTSLIP